VHVGLLAAGVGFLALFIHRVDTHKVAESIRRLDATTLGVALAAYTAAWALRVWRLHMLARAIAIPLTTRAAASVALGANALNLVAPARLGDVAAFVQLRLASGRGAEAAAAVLSWRLADLGALLALGLVAGLPILLLVPLAHAETGLLWTMGAGAGFLFLAALAAWLSRHKRSKAVLARLAQRLLGSRAPTGAAFGRATAALWSPRLLAAGLGLAMAAWIGDAVVAGAILEALWGGPNAYLIALIPLLLANAAKMLPTTPGSIGVFEAVFAATLLAYGVPAATAVAAAVATHLFMNLYTLAVGIPGAVAAGRSVSRSLSR
jgi:hypothetical protein